MAITITGTLIIDETSGKQNATAGGSDITGNDVKDGLGFLTTGVTAFDTLLNAVVVQDLTGVNVTVAVSNGTSADLDGSSMLSGFGADVTDLAFTNSTGGPLLGEEALSAPGVPLLTVDGRKIYLYSYTGADLGIDENNVVFGRKANADGTANATGDIVFAAYLQPTDASGAVQTSDLNAVGSKVWLVQYEEIQHPITTNPDDALSLYNLHVSVSNRSDFSLQGAPSGQNLFLMYGDGTPSPTDAVIIVTGRDPINQSSDPSAITSGDTVNTGQGGGPTTLGTNSQQIVAGTGLYFTFAKGANPDYTVNIDHSATSVGFLDQNEADVEANIDFTSLYGSNGASFSVVQSSSGDKSTLEISAFTTAYKPGVEFIDNLHDNTAVEVNKVAITTQPTGHGKNAVPGETLVFDKINIGTNPTTLSGITVTFSANTVVIKGLEANDLITYNTAVPHSRALIDNIGSTDTNFDAPFDIGGFSLVNSNVTPNPFSALTFHDDGPSVTVSATTESAILLTTQDAETDGDPTAQDSAATTVDFSGVFGNLPAYGADGAGTTVKSYALSLYGANGSDSLLDSNGVQINLYNVSGLIVGSTALTAAAITTGNTIFSIGVVPSGANAGIVTLTQYAEIDHALENPTTAPFDDQFAVLANNLIKLTGTALSTDGDGDTATDSEDVDLGGNVRFADDGPSVTVSATTESAILLTTQDAETDGDPTTQDSAATTVDFSGVFGNLPAYGADGAGTTVKSYALSLYGANGSDSLLDSNGVQINLYNVSGLIVGSTALTAAAITTGNTIFSIGVVPSGANAGIVTLTQYAEIDHALENPTTAPFDDQFAVLANNLVKLTGTALSTDGDGDTATDSEDVDLGGNVRFADDGPSVSANATVLLDDDAKTGGNPGGDGDDADSANVSGITLGHVFGADGAGTVAYLTSGAPTGFTYVADGTSLLVKQGTTTVLTLTMVAATGAYSVVQNSPILHVAGLTENNQAFTINYRVTDGDGDTADGTLGINVDDDTPVVTAKSSLVYANGSNGALVTDEGGTGVFAYSIGADQHVAPYSSLNSDFLSVTLTGVTVGANAITNKSVTWVSETDSQAVFNVGFTYVSNPTQGSTSNATGTLVFDKVADTYTLKLAQEIESFSILNTSTPGNPLQGYAFNSDATVGSNPPVSVMTLASNFFVQFEGFGVNNGTAQTFAYDTTTGLFSNDRRYVTVSSNSIGAASDTLQSDEVIDLDFFVDNPKGHTDSAVERATSKAIFIEFTQAGIGAGKDMLVVLKLVDDATGDTINRTFIVGNSAGNDDVINTSVPSYGFVAQAQNGIVVFESNDYNFSGENYSIQGAQVVTSTQNTTGTGYQLNGAIDNPATGTVEGATLSTSLTNFGGATTEGNNEPIKIVNIGFVASATPDAHLTFDVVLADADGDATATQTLDVTIVGDNRVTASTGADTFVIADTDVDGLFSMALTVIDGGFASGSDTFNFTLAGSGTNYTEVLAPVTNLAAFTAAADIALDGTKTYYFGVVGNDGYLAFDGDGSGITAIIQLVGVADIASTDIV